ncbi:MAG TPA: DUF362 domain-containing protein [Bacteroidota bacterium]
MNPIVYIDRLDLKPDGRQFDAAAHAIELGPAVHAARAVFIKPNLTYPYYKKGVTTRAESVEEIVKMLLRINRKLKIFVGEGEGGYNSFSMSKAMSDMGFDDIAVRHSNVEIVNLSSIPTKSIEIKTQKGPYRLDLPEMFFKEVDFSISVPLPKIHCITKVTLSYKNQWGCLPDVMRLKNHYMFSHLISNIASLLKFKYAFLDGKYGLDVNGPMDGDPVEVNWFVASNSLGAFDMVVSEMMGFDWKQVRHLKTSAKYGDMPNRETVQIIGDINLLKRKFTLRRSIWNYPALAGFQSKNLTQLFYFSRWAKFLHDVMYTFRERPIQ